MVRQILTWQKGQVKKRSASSSVMGALHWVHRCSTIHEPAIIDSVSRRIGYNKQMTEGSQFGNGCISLPPASSLSPARIVDKNVLLAAGSFRIADIGE